jgi:hypothetical protein
MGKKSKADGLAKKDTKPKEAKKTQSERFIEAARKIGVDESGREFQRAFRKIVLPARERKS